MIYSFNIFIEIVAAIAKMIKYIEKTFRQNSCKTYCHSVSVDRSLC